MRSFQTGLPNPVERSGDRLDGSVGVGGIDFFEFDPGPDWIVCDGRSLAPGNDNRRVLGADVSSFSTAGLGTISTPGSPSVRGAILGESFVLPIGSYGVWRSGNRGVSFQQTLGPQSGGGYYDSVAFGDKIVVAAGNSGIRVSSDGGVTWVDPGPIVVSSISLYPSRFKVIAGALYAVNGIGGQNAIFRTVDLVNWSVFPVGVLNSNDGALADIDFANGEFIAVTTSGPAFYRSTDLTNWTLVTRLSGNVPYYLSFLGGLWIAWGPFGAIVRGANGAFAARANAMAAVFWNGVEFVGGGGAAGTIRVSPDFEGFADKAVSGFTNNSPVYGVYQYDDGQMIAVQTSGNDTKSFATTRAVRAPKAPQVRPTSVRGKPYVRVR